MTWLEKNRQLCLKYKSSEAANEFKWTAFIYTKGALDMLCDAAGAKVRCRPELAFRLYCQDFSPLKEDRKLISFGVITLHLLSAI